jgi:hypothetical protein
VGSRLRWPRRPADGPEPVYERDKRWNQAVWVMRAHDTAALVMFAAAVVLGALGSPLLTAVVCAASVWTSFHGAMGAARIVQHPIWRLHGDAVLRWVPVFFAMFAGLIGGGLDAVVGR